jgi:hypothetical protein
LKSKIDRGYRPVKRIAKNATIVSRKKAMNRKKSTMKCGIASSHLTSQSQRLTCGSSPPSTRTG